MKLANKKDHKRLCEIIENHYSNPPILFNPSIPEKPSQIEPSENEFWAIETIENQIVAFLHIRKSIDGYGDFEIVVDPYSRRKGIAKKLLKETINFVQQKPDWQGLKAGIKSGNIGSKKLIERFGFECTNDSRMGSDWKLTFDH